MRDTSDNFYLIFFNLIFKLDVYLNDSFDIIFRIILTTMKTIIFSNNLFLVKRNWNFISKNLRESAIFYILLE